MIAKILAQNAPPAMLTFGQTWYPSYLIRFKNTFLTVYIEYFENCPNFIKILIFSNAVQKMGTILLVTPLSWFQIGLILTF